MRRRFRSVLQVLPRDDRRHGAEFSRNGWRHNHPGPPKTVFNQTHHTLTLHHPHKALPIENLACRFTNGRVAPLRRRPHAASDDKQELARQCRDRRNHVGFLHFISQFLHKVVVAFLDRTNLIDCEQLTPTVDAA